MSRSPRDLQRPWAPPRPWPRSGGGHGHEPAQQRLRIPAVDARRAAAGPAHRPHRSSRMVTAGPDHVAGRRPRAAFENAMRVHAAIGGSTNAVVHLLALAGRSGRGADPGGLRPPRRATCRCWSICKPSGELPDGGVLHYAGGLPAVLKETGRPVPAPRGAHRHRRQRMGEQSPTPRRSSTREVIRNAWRPRSSPSAASGCCAATWPPTGRS